MIVVVKIHDDLIIAEVDDSTYQDWASEYRNNITLNSPMKVIGDCYFVSWTTLLDSDSIVVQKHHIVYMEAASTVTAGKYIAAKSDNSELIKG